MKPHHISLLFIFILCMACTSAQATDAITPAQSGTSSQPSQASAYPGVEKWWNGDSPTLGWFGLDPLLKDYGLKISGIAREDFFGQIGGGLPNQTRDNWATDINVKAIFDFEKLTGLKGLTLQSGWRYRDDRNPALPAGTSGPSSLFAPTNITTCVGMRIMPQQLEYTTPGKTFTINAGWENPYEQFLQQPLSKLFQNNSIYAAKGIGGQAGPGVPVINSDIASSGGNPGVGTATKGGIRYYPTSPVPWSASYASWGGTLKVVPVKDFYIQSGLYESIACETGVNPTQFLATSVYPYTSVPADYMGKLKSSGEITRVIGADGHVIPGALQNLGWFPSSVNNHGFDFCGAHHFNPSVYVAVKPTNSSGGTIYGTADGSSTYINSKGQYVTSPALYAASPYDQGGFHGSYSGNGLYNVNEIGWTPKFGEDKLEGKYAVGGYYWGQPNTNYTPTQFTVSVFNPSTGKVAYTSYGATKPNPFTENQYVWGMYFQADQQIFRLHEDGLKEGKLSERGLYIFNEFTFTPPENNALPYYFQTGLVFKGPLEFRPKDSVGIALGAGFYSSYLNDYTQSQNRQLQNALGSAFNATVPDGPTQQGAVNPQTGAIATGKTSKLPLTNYYAYLPNYTSTKVIEGFYKIQINRWASIKPDVQCIINPAGNHTLGTDWILGFSAAVTF